MDDELTPFPDGIGFMEYGWDALTPTQRVVLMKRAGHPSRRYGRPNALSMRALRSSGLIPDSPSADVTARGKALAEFAIRTGRWLT